MPRWTKFVQANFTHGEYAPQVWGRIDTKLYSSGLRHGLNGILLPQGGIRIRPGSDLFDQIVDAPVRLGGMFYNPDEIYLFIFQAGSFAIYDSATMTPIASFTGLPWQAADMARLYFMSVQGTMIICHENFWSIRVMRHDVHLFAWDIYPFEFSPGLDYLYLPYYKFAPAPMTIQPSAVGPGDITMSTNGPFWSLLHDDLTAQGQPTHIELTYPADPVAGTVTLKFTLLVKSVTDNIHAVCTLLGTKPLPNTKPQVQWKEQVFSAVWGYPRCVGYHDQRILFAGHPHAPGLFMASMVGAPYNFDVGTAEDDQAIIAVIATESSNQIRSILSGHHLTVMTSQGPFYYPGSDTAPLTPSTVTFRRTAAAQASWTPAVFYDLAAMYVQRRGGHVRELVYDLYQQAYTADAITLLSAHLVKSPVELNVMEPDDTNQNRYMIALNNDGTVSAYLGDRDQEVSGWTPWSTQGTIKSICGVGEFFFMAVERIRNGVPQINIERMNFNYVLDSTTNYTSATAKTVWTGLTPWRSMTVDVIGDGYYMGRYAVTAAGQLTLPGNFACKTLVVGLSFPINWQSMAIDQMLSDGPKQGRPYSLASTVARLTNTEALRVNGQRLWVRVPKDPTGLPPPLYTGPREIFINGWKTDFPITMTLDYPCMVEVDSINVEMNI